MFFYCSLMVNNVLAYYHVLSFCTPLCRHPQRLWNTTFTPKENKQIKFSHRFWTKVLPLIISYLWRHPCNQKTWCIITIFSPRIISNNLGSFVRNWEVTSNMRLNCWICWFGDVHKLTMLIMLQWWWCTCYQRRRVV